MNPRPRRSRLTDLDEADFARLFDELNGDLDAAIPSSDRLTMQDELAELEHVLATVHLAELQVESPPANVMGRLHRTARERFGADGGKPGMSALVAAGGWITAIAASVLLLLTSLETTTPIAERYAALVTEAGDLIQLDWQPDTKLVGDSVSGGIAWSSERQEGYMRFRGLAPNDPQVEQFQLWMFDQTRHRWEEQPVDGGVFDVTSSGDVLVPIRPNIPVAKAVLFAVTVEKPGGVVVSQRERLILTAAL